MCLQIDISHIQIHADVMLIRTRHLNGQNGTKIYQLATFCDNFCGFGSLSESDQHVCLTIGKANFDNIAN